MNTYTFWKKMFIKEQKLKNPPNRFYVIRRNEKKLIKEIYQVYSLDNHKQENIYTLKEVLKEMETDKKLRESHHNV